MKAWKLYRVQDMRGFSIRRFSLALVTTVCCWLGVVPLDRTSARAVTVPVEVATGPALFQLDRPRFGAEPNALAADQPWHFGWRLEIAAVIDEEWAREHPAYVPPQHRKRLAEVGEVRYSPAVLSLIPRSVIISPKFWDTGVYGSTWEFVRVGVAGGLEAVRIRARGGLIGTYAFMHSDSDRLPSTFHFIRPGLDLELGLYVPIGDAGGFSLGWTSNVYIPQAIGGGVFQFTGDRGVLWHIGEAYALLHVRFPYDANM